MKMENMAEKDLPGMSSPCKGWNRSPEQPLTAAEGSNSFFPLCRGSCYWVGIL